MSTWAEARPEIDNPWMGADASAGSGMAGQHVVTADERAGYNADMDSFSKSEGEYMKKLSHGKQSTPTEEMLSAHRIGQCYTWEGKQAYLKEAQAKPLGDMSDPEARLQALSHITQDRPDDGTPGGGQVGQSTCAGASIVGAAFLAEGPEGLKKVVAAMEKLDTDKTFKGDMGALKKMLADPSKMSVADIQKLQLKLTDVMHYYEKPEDNLKGDAGIANPTMDHFLEQSPELSGMLKKNGMEVEFISNQGSLNEQGSVDPNHYVMKIKGKDGKGDMIYDPLARRGGQVIACENGVKQYDNATQDHIGDDIHPYAN